MCVKDLWLKLDELRYPLAHLANVLLVGKPREPKHRQWFWDSKDSHEVVKPLKEEKEVEEEEEEEEGGGGNIWYNEATAFKDLV